MNIVSGDPNFIEIRSVLYQFKKHKIRSIFTNLGWIVLISITRRIKIGSINIVQESMIFTMEQKSYDDKASDR